MIGIGAIIGGGVYAKSAFNKIKEFTNSLSKVCDVFGRIKDPRDSLSNYDNFHREYMRGYSNSKYFSNFYSHVINVQNCCADRCLNNLTYKYFTIKQNINIEKDKFKKFSRLMTRACNAFRYFDSIDSENGSNPEGEFEKFKKACEELFNNDDVNVMEIVNSITPSRMY